MNRFFVHLNAGCVSVVTNFIFHPGVVAMVQIIRNATRVFLLLGLVWLPCAQALDQPAGKVVLTIRGNITQANQGNEAAFDMKMLAQMPQITFTTQTPWYPLPITFTGPLMRDVLAAAGAKPGKIVALSLNDYKSEIPAEDPAQQDMIIARLMNGKPMPVREKGPLFIVYPYESKRELSSEIYYNRSAWQLRTLTVQ
jgi:hypothetical protein